MKPIALIFAPSLILMAVVCAADTRGLRDQPADKTPKSPPTATKTPVAKAVKGADLPAQIAALIKQLADPSWEVRENATKKLIEIGAPARKALREAAKSADAEVAARARRALEKIPWATSPSDPPDIAELMGQYEAAERDERIHLVQSRQDGLRGKSRSKSIPPLLRIADNDPDDEIALLAAEMLQEHGLGSVGEAVRQSPFENERLATLALQGWAWHLHDRKKAATLFEKALSQQQSAAAGHVGELTRAGLLEVFGGLLELGEADRVLAELPKFEKLYENDSRLLYSRAKAVELKGDKAEAQKLITQALALPFTATEESLDTHELASDFLKAHKWHDWEAAEWRAMLAQPHLPARVKVEAQARLGWLAEQAARFDEAAEHYLAAGDTAQDTNTALGRGDPEELQAQGQWNRARAMMAKGETARLEETLKDMLRLYPGHPDGAGELARFYIAHGRADEAEKVLAEAREEIQKKYENQNEEITGHNDLAWLYVVANLHVDEALAEASKAIAQAPYEVAFLDTLAEAYFRNGQKEKAIEKEKYALSLEPDNDYLKRQIKRFETKTKDEPVPLQR